MIRSPSFSRSSSSTITTMRPARMFVEQFGDGGEAHACVSPARISAFTEQALDVARDQVHFQVHRIADRGLRERGVRDVCGTSATSKPVVVDRVDGQADAVDADRALRRDVAQQRRRRARTRQRCARASSHDVQHAADAVDVAADQVPAEAVGRAASRVRGSARAPTARSPSVVSASVSLDASASKPRVVERDHGQAHAVDGDAFAQRTSAPLHQAGCRRRCAAARRRRAFRATPAGRRLRSIR